jgi:hypothetical protein
VAFVVVVVAFMVMVAARSSAIVGVVCVWVVVGVCSWLYGVGGGMGVIGVGAGVVGLVGVVGCDVGGDVVVVANVGGVVGGSGDWV